MESMAMLSSKYRLLLLQSFDQYSVQFLGIAEIRSKWLVITKSHSLNWPKFEGWQMQSENCTDYC
jgi:hypothetical protein